MIVKELYRNNILGTPGGNISGREDDSIFVTKRNSSYDKQWDLTEEDIIEEDPLGKDRNPQMQVFITRESRNHYRVLNEIPDIKAAFHVHSRYLYSTCFTKKISLPIITSLAWDHGFPKYIQYIKAEPAVSIGEVEATTKYFKYLYNKNPNEGFVYFLRVHRAVIFSKSLKDAFTKLQTLENNTWTFLYMEIIKSSEHFKEYRIRQSNDMFDSWVDIQNTPIKKIDFYFKKEGVEF